MSKYHFYRLCESGDYSYGKPQDLNIYMRLREGMTADQVAEQLRGTPGFYQGMFSVKKSGKKYRILAHGSFLKDSSGKVTPAGKGIEQYVLVPQTEQDITDTDSDLD